MKFAYFLTSGLCVQLLACTLPDVKVQPASSQMPEMGAEDDAGPTTQSRGNGSKNSSNASSTPTMGRAGAGGGSGGRSAAGSGGTASATAGKGSAGASAATSGSAAPQAGSGAADSGNTTQPSTGYSPATKIDFGSTRIGAKLAIDGQGNFMLAWTQEIEDEKRQAWARRYDAGTGWGEATMLSDSRSTNLTALAMDPEGRALVLLSASPASAPTAGSLSGLEQDLLGRAYANGAWGPAKLLGSAFGGTTTLLAMNKLGNAVASWMGVVNSSETSAWTLRITRFSPSSGWGSKFDIAEVSANTGDSEDARDDAINWPSRASLAIGAADDVVIGWSRTTDIPVWAYIVGGDDLRTPSPQLQPPEPMASMAKYAFPQVAIDGDKRALVLWATKDASGNHIRSQRFEPGVGWTQAPSSIERSSSADLHDPKVAMDVKGNAIAIWPEADGQLWFNRFDVDSGWGTAERVDPMNTASSATGPAIAFDASGTALASWNDGKDIRASRYVAGSGWTTPEKLNTQDAGGSPPQISMAANGTALIAWEEELGPSDSNYWYSIYRAP